MEVGWGLGAQGWLVPSLPPSPSAAAALGAGRVRRILFKRKPARGGRALGGALQARPAGAPRPHRRTPPPPPRWRPGAGLGVWERWAACARPSAHAVNFPGGRALAAAEADTRWACAGARRRLRADICLRKALCA